MLELSQFAQKIKDLIAKNAIHEAMQKLRGLLEGSPLLSSVLQAQAKHSDIISRLHKGTITQEEARVGTNQIIESLLALLNRIEGKVSTDSAIEEEVREYLINIENLHIGDKVERDNIVIGTIQGDFVMGDKHIGDKIYVQYVEKKILKILGRPPFVSRIFVGREKDIETIRRKFFKEENMLLLANGEGGIGKTSLAAHYYEGHQHTYKHLAWILAENDILNALLTLAYPLRIEFPERMPKEERVEVLLQEMASLQSPSLLVIDNANDLEDLENVYLALRSLPNFHVLLTTRISSFEEEVFYRVEPLPEQIVISLFKTHYPGHDPEEDELLYGIIDAVGFNTLAIELLAKNLKIINQIETEYCLTDLWKDLQKRKLLSLQRSKEVKVSYKAKGFALRKEKPEDIIKAMYDLRELDQGEYKSLSIFSVLPPENISAEILKSFLPDFQNLKKSILAIAQKGWIEYNATEISFKVSPVIQEVCIAKTENLFDNCKDLISNLNNKLQFNAVGESGIEIPNYEEAILGIRYGESILNSINSLDYQLVLLNEKMGTFHKTKGNLKDALRFYGQQNKLAEKLYEANPQNDFFKYIITISYNHLGNTYRSLGNIMDALSFYKMDIELSQELCEAHPQSFEFKNSLGISYEKLGEIHLSLGNLEEAMQCFQMRFQISHELHQLFPQNESFLYGFAISSQWLGNLYQSLGNIDEAMKLFNLYNELAKQLYEVYPENAEFKNILAISYLKIGGVHGLLGNLKEALQFFQQHNHLEQQLYEEHPYNIGFKNSLAGSFANLGQVYKVKGDLNQAKLHFRKAELLFEELVNDSPNQVEFQTKLKQLKEQMRN